MCDEKDIIFKYYCNQSFPDHFAIRKRILAKAMCDDVDLIVTSNNFFAIFPSSILIGKEYVEQYIISEINGIENKKPLITGFDLLNSRIAFNPYGGVNAIVCSIFVDNNNNFFCDTYVWESWISKMVCDQAAFVDQNRRRITSVNNINFCLLSCGDVFSCCNDSGKLLPNADIYLSLAHMNFRKWFVRLKDANNDEANIQKWKMNSELIVIITQQISKEFFNKLDKNFFKINNSNLEYQLIWPASNRLNQKLLMYDMNENLVDKPNDAQFVFIDICI